MLITHNPPNLSHRVPGSPPFYLDLTSFHPVPAWVPPSSSYTRLSHVGTALVRQSECPTDSVLFLLHREGRTSRSLHRLDNLWHVNPRHGARVTMLISSSQFEFQELPLPSFSNV
jgi:hypothetical protein